MRAPWNRHGGESLRQPLPAARLTAFAAIGLLCLAYLLFSVVGAKTFEGQYGVAVQLSATGGLFPGSQVTYRGVPVGTVSSIDIAPGETGVVAHLEIHSGVKVPSRTKAVVADRSPAGEQYLDLQPTGAGPPYLTAGSTIGVSQTRLPPSLADLLGSVASFSKSVNTRELRTVFTQLDLALHGTGPALGRIIDNTAEIVSTLRAVEPQTIDLLDNGGKLLDTQAAHGDDLHTFSVSLRKLADTLRRDNPKTTKLISTAAATTRQVEPLLRDDAGSISALLTNLVRTGTIVDDRIPGLKALLVATPKGLSALASAVHGGHVQFKLIGQTGRACPYKTRRQMPYVDKKNPPIFNAYCLRPSPTYQQRGAINAPRPPGDKTAGPGSGAKTGTRNRRSIRGTSRAHAHSDSWMNVFAAGES
jgi:phospholipid/cholesterol/gamma-HCH transport system substrate-binding protein